VIVPRTTTPRRLPPLVEPGPPLDPDELARYSRQLSLPGIGPEGQRRLRAARVLVIGAGGLGAPVLQYLAAAGVGAITVIDDDVVESSNLQRQVIHRDADRGRSKAESARDALRRLDPGAQVRAIRGRLEPGNALELFSQHDLVIDGTDNFATRYLSNDAAELTGVPLVWGTIFRFTGQVSVFWPEHGPMLRDLFPDIPAADSVPSCAEGGVLGALCGAVGSTMAIEAVKLICGVGEPLIGRFWRTDALAATTSIPGSSATPIGRALRASPRSRSRAPRPDRSTSRRAGSRPAKRRHSPMPGSLCSSTCARRGSARSRASRARGPRRSASSRRTAGPPSARCPRA
jgi:adenylyltransferase/sulfurtransferase